VLKSLYPPGKGEKKTAFTSQLSPALRSVWISLYEKEFVSYTIDRSKIDSATRILNLHEAVTRLQNSISKKARRHVDHEERAVEMWVLVLPEIIFERCNQAQKRAGLPMEIRRFRKATEKTFGFAASQSTSWTMKRGNL